MDPCETYQRQRAFGLTRIDMLLALYDGGMARLEESCAALARNDPETALPLLLRTQRIVAKLIAGLDLQHGEVPHNLKSLYEFVLRSIADRTASGAQSALRV